MSSIGVIKLMFNPAHAEKSAIDRLKFFLQSAPEPIIFDCSRCGAERILNGPIPDPGVLMFRDCTCEDIRKDCESPAKPKTKKRQHYYKPGSLVFAPLDGKILWPGIIEYPPDGCEGYVIPGKTANNPKAYWVTFIHSWNEDHSWFGGFIATCDIRPIEKPGNLPNDFEKTERKFQQAVERAFSGIPYSLADRLREFSFVAWAARERQIELPAFRHRPEGSWQGTATKRRSLDEPGPSGVPRKQQKTQAQVEEEAQAAQEEAERPKRPLGILATYRMWKAGGSKDAGAKRKKDPDTGSGEEDSTPKE